MQEVAHLRAKLMFKECSNALAKSFNEHIKKNFGLHLCKEQDNQNNKNDLGSEL